MRVFLGFDQLGLEAHGRQVVADEGRRPPRVGVMVRLGTDAGNPDQGLELFLEIAPMRLEVGIHAIHGHDGSPFLFPGSQGCFRN